MKQLAALEWKRNRFTSYHIAVAVIAAILLGMLYLFAAIPRLDGESADAAMFLSYDTILGFVNIISMAAFTILFAVLASRVIVGEYEGKKAILLFSYPVERKKVLDAKLILVFSYSVLAMLLSGGALYLVFFTTESLFPLCPDVITMGLIGRSLALLLCDSLLSGLLGMIALWFGFWKKSVSVTIVAACILVAIVCQMMGLSLFNRPIILGVLAFALLAAALVRIHLHRRLDNMEV